MKIKGLIFKEVHVTYEFSVSQRTGAVFFVNELLKITTIVLDLYGKVLIVEWKDGRGGLL